MRLQKVSSDALWNISTLLLSMLFGLIVTSIAVRELGLEQFGYFGLISIILAPFAMGGLGFSDSLTKFISEYIVSNDYVAARKHTQTVIFMAILVGIGGATLVSLLGPVLLKDIFSIPSSNINEVRVAIYWVATSWAIQQLSGVYVALAAGLQAFKQLAIINFISIIVTSSIQLVMLSNGYGLNGFVSGMAIGNFFGLICWIVSIKRMAQWMTPFPVFEIFFWKKSFHFGGWQTLGQVGGILANQSERFILGAYLSPALLGIYNTVIKLEQSAYLVSFKMTEVLYPYFSSTSGSAKSVGALNLMRASWLTTVVGVSMLAPLIPFGKSLLTVWVGADVADQSGLLMIFFALGGMLGCATNSSYFFMLGHGRTRLTAGLSVATGITSIIFAWIFLPRFGFTAAAWAGIAAMLIQIVVLSLAIKQYFNEEINYLKIFIWFYVPVLVGIIMAMITLLIDIKSENWLQSIFNCISFGIVVGFINVIISWLLPGGQIRWNDICKITNHFCAILLRWK